MRERAMSNSITVLILGIETIKEKNLNQLIGLSRYGYQFVILTTDLLRNFAKLLEIQIM